MSTSGNTKTVKTPTKDEVIEKLQTELVDLKDLYDNAIKENKELTNERNELKAEVLEKSNILLESKDEHETDLEELRDTIVEMEKEDVKSEAIISELRYHNENLNSIIENLIDNK